jgi:hypothetical protein
VNAVGKALARLRLAAITAAWLTAVAASSVVLLDYQQTPGVPADPPGEWPAETTLARVPGRYALVLLLHPRCPCSAATLVELDRLMSRVPGRMTAHVVFWKPSDLPQGWETTDLWSRATQIPDVHVARDDDGREARRFHAVTSGQAILYDGAGRLAFSGGITPGRGHAGDNVGEEAIVSLLTEGTAPVRTAPVYGCSLVDPIDAHG